ncbi:MAG: LEA type 2 family protein [Archaeoglobaceae archaeon]|nr:LEA type 2 family protein [Archaeoglobaceae archaeon]MDW8013510.1 LEA type 2 family protein [Archaeoglobaceae archaeon]
MLRVLILLLITALTFCLQFGKPEVKSVTNCWGKVTNSETEILTEIIVYNPNPIPLPLKDVLTEIYMNDLKMGEGKALKAEMPPGNSSLIISTKIDNSKIPEWWVTHVKSGEVTNFKFKGYVVFDLKITEFRYPFERSILIKTDLLSIVSDQKIKVGPSALTLKSLSFHWGKVEKDYTEVLTTAKIYNENPFPVSITKLRYSLEMNEVKIAEEIKKIETVIPPKAESTLNFTIKMNNEMLDDWFASHVENRERTNFKILLEFMEVFGSEIFVKSESSFETAIFGCYLADSTTTFGGSLKDLKNITK